MKKYISPEIVVVQLRMKHMLAESFIDLYNDEQVTDNGEILTKGVINDKNIWDEEW